MLTKIYVIFGVWDMARFCITHFDTDAANNGPYHNAVKVYLDHCANNLYTNTCFTVNDDFTSSYTTPIDGFSTKDNDEQSQSCIPIYDNDTSIMHVSKPTAVENLDLKDNFVQKQSIQIDDKDTKDNSICKHPIIEKCRYLR